MKAILYLAIMYRSRFNPNQDQLLTRSPTGPWEMLLLFHKYIFFSKISTCIFMTAMKKIFMPTASICVLQYPFDESTSVEVMAPYHQATSH